MLLGLSSEAIGSPADLAVAVDAEAAGDAGVEAGPELRRFCHAVLRSDGDLERAREALLNVVGPAALVEAAGVVAQFDSINRIADATGTELDDLMAAAMPAVLDGLGVEAMRTD